MGQNGLSRAEHCGAFACQTVESAGGGKTFDLPPVEQPRIDPLGEIVERLERAFRLALLNQGLHSLLADALQRAQSVTNLPSFYRKVGA